MAIGDASGLGRLGSAFGVATIVAGREVVLDQEAEEREGGERSLCAEPHQYGRNLRIIERDEESVGDTVVSH
jgi:hypothetical protein